jgi:hypothetical protein
MLPHLGPEFFDCMRHHLEAEEEVDFEMPRWLRRCQALYIVVACAGAISLLAFLLF